MTFHLILTESVLFQQQSNSNSPNEKRRNELFDGEEPTDIEQLKHQLTVERKLRQEAERELNSQVGIQEIQTWKFLFKKY